MLKKSVCASSRKIVARYSVLPPPRRNIFTWLDTRHEQSFQSTIDLLYSTKPRLSGPAFVKFEADSNRNVTTLLLKRIFDADVAETTLLLSQSKIQSTEEKDTLINYSNFLWAKEMNQETHIPGGFSGLCLAAWFYNPMILIVGWPVKFFLEAALFNRRPEWNRRAIATICAKAEVIESTLR